jgi:hypothetical protein
MSKCGHCGSGTFALQLVEPRGSRFKLYFIQCSSCGVPVGVQEFHNVGATLDKQSKAIKQIAQKLGVSVDL